MTSDPYRARRVFVWTWQPGESTPLVAGVVDRVGADGRPDGRCLSQGRDTRLLG